MTYTIEVSLKKAFRDSHGEHVLHDIQDLGIRQVSRVRYHPVYRIDGELAPREAESIAAALLTDPVTQEYRVTENESSLTGPRRGSAARSVEVWLKPGVTDTVAESVLKAVRDMGIDRPLKVKTGHKFVIEGSLTAAAVRQIAEKLLANPMVQVYNIQ